MSANEVVAFWKALDSNDKVSTELDKIFSENDEGGTNADRIVALGATHGFTFDAEELQAFLGAQQAELSEEELATAAGGAIFAKYDFLPTPMFKVEIEGIQPGVILFR